MAQQNLNNVTTASSITPASDYLIISKGGTAINKVAAATALSNEFGAAAKKTSIASTDSLMMATGGTTANRIDYNVLAKAIIEQYNGSTIAGSAQTLQSALNALNSKWTVLAQYGNVSLDNIDSFTNTGIYEVFYTGGMPYTGVCGTLIVISGANVKEQIIITTKGIATRHWESNAWNDFKKVDLS